MKKWVTTWAMAHTGAAAFALNMENRTTNTRIICPISGTKIRIALGNRYGTEDIHLSSAALWVNGRVMPVTFNGQSGITLQQGAEIRSDAVDLPVHAGEPVEVRLYYAQPQILSSGNALLRATHSPEGDYTQAASFVESQQSVWASEMRPFPLPEPVTALTALDVYTAGAEGFAVLGDSNTFNGFFTSALQSLLAPRNIPVLNLGISGNRLIRDSGVPSMGELFGKAAKDRVAWDIFSHCGIGCVLICVGGNDIFQPGTFAAAEEELPSADALWEATKHLALRCREQGLKVLGSTLIPFAGADGYTVQKQSVADAFHDKVRKSNIFDAVIDFAALLADPANPNTYRPEYDSGDHLHFNALAGACVAEEIAKYL